MWLCDGSNAHFVHLEVDSVLAAACVAEETGGQAERDRPGHGERREERARGRLGLRPGPREPATPYIARFRLPWPVAFRPEQSPNGDCPGKRHALLPPYRLTLLVVRRGQVRSVTGPARRRAGPGPPGADLALPGGSGEKRTPGTAARCVWDLPRHSSVLIAPALVRRATCVRFAPFLRHARGSDSEKRPSTGRSPRGNIVHPSCTWQLARVVSPGIGDDARSSGHRAAPGHFSEPRPGPSPQAGVANRTRLGGDSTTPCERDSTMSVCLVHNGRPGAEVGSPRHGTRNRRERRGQWPDGPVELDIGGPL